MHTHETLHPREHFTPSPAPETQGNARVTLAHADHIHASRRTMLEGLASQIGTRLFEALTRKVDHERTALLELIERDTKAAETKQRLDKVLRTEFFAYRKLDTNLL